MRRAAVLLSALTAMTTSLGLLAAVPAAQAEPARAAAVVPRILSPVDGAVLDAPVTSVRVDFTGVEPGEWQIRNYTAVRGECGTLACPGDTFVDVRAGDRVREVELDSPLDHEGDYGLSVQDDPVAPDAVASSAFTLTSDATYAGVRQEAASFTPDGDGVADRTVLRFATRGGVGRPVARVLAPPSSGSIAEATVTGNDYDGWTVTWDGRAYDGDVTFPGDYLLAVDVPDANGVLSRLERRVRLGEQPRAGRSVVPGAPPASHGSRGRCGTRVGGGTTTLSCTGRGVARVTYRLPVPAGARVTRVWVRRTTVTAAGGAPARVERRLVRVGPRYATVVVRASGDVYATVQRVGLRWRLPDGR